MPDRPQVNDNFSLQSQQKAPIQKHKVLVSILEAQSVGLNLVTASMLLNEHQEVTHG